MRRPITHALRQSSDDHPMVLLGVVVSALFIWVLAPAQETGSKHRHDFSAPVQTIHEPTTTKKTSRLPTRSGGRDCEGRSRGSESLECLTMIARDSGKEEGEIRVVLAAMPSGLDTPNVF
jgi:hypothetical protein